jgi:hypothetical protein
MQLRARVSANTVASASDYQSYAVMSSFKCTEEMHSELNRAGNNL